MRRFLLASALLSIAPLHAATYQVGPTRTYTDLNMLFNAIDLGAGDVVEVDGNVSYAAAAPGIIMRDTDSGAPGNPVVLRGIIVNGNRPLLVGANNATANTIEFRSSNHVVFENFEVTGSGNISSGTFRCIYHHAHDITIRNVIVRDCPRQGILGADTDSGSLTVEYSEIRNAGSNGGNHAIYMSTDQIAYPGSVFRLQYSYLHDSQFDSGQIGGNLIKSRAERNEIYYNWLEDAFYHELELIGPDPDGVAAGWTDATAREDSDVVGNVIVHTSDFGSVLRFGGDGTSGGRGESFGRYRFVNNTVIRRNPNNDTPTIFRLFEGIESLDFHNNVIWREGGSSLTLVRAVEAQWTNGPRVRGSNNWIKTGFAYNPAALVNSVTATISGTDPGFVSLASYDLLPVLGSPLLEAGSTTAASATGYELSNPLFPPARHPPQRALIPVGTAPLRPNSAPIDIGAFERDSLNSIFSSGFESL